MAGTGNCGGVKWPAQQVGIKPQSEVDAASTGEEFWFGTTDGTSPALSGVESNHLSKGVQSIGFDPTFETTPIFQLCQSELYELNEGLPEINISATKALDGYCPMYLQATQDADSPSLFGRQACKAALAIGIFPCDLDSTIGDPDHVVVFKESNVNSISYTFTVEGAFTEEVSWISNNMVWTDPVGGHPALQGSGCIPSAAFLAEQASIAFPGQCPTNDAVPRTKVNFTEDFIFDFSITTTDSNGAIEDPDTTILPPEVFGVNISGVNIDDAACIQNITVSADLNREDIKCLGRRGPKNRTITLPVPVNTSVEVVSDDGALVSATELGVCSGVQDTACVTDARCSTVGTNLPNRTIRIATCEGTRIYTGKRNKLSGISRSGGDTGGTNVSITYTFQTFNTMTVMHCHDCSPSGATWWADRANLLA